MNKFAAFLLALAPMSAQDPRQIIQEVQKRQHSDSQRYEGTLEVMSQGNQLATSAGYTSASDRSETARRF